MHDDYQLPTIKRPELDLSRFQVVERNLNDRQAALKQFCDRMPDLKPSLIAAKMSHLSTDQLNETYHLFNKRAKNFTAFWRWHFMPKKR